MTARLAQAVAAAAAVTVVAIIVLGGSNPYVLRTTMSNANGLRDGSAVDIAGVPVGSVSLRTNRANEVVATLDIDRSHAPVGRNVAIEISAVNLLGQKRIDLVDSSPGENPAPSGYAIPAARVTASTDLDQVLDVLDAPTRSALAVLVNEMGAAVTGRRADFSQLVGQLPGSLTAARALLAQFVTDNHTVSDLVANSDQLVATLSVHRADLAKLVDTLGQSAATLATRTSQLESTLAQTPTTLATARAFLARLQQTTAPLGHAAHDVIAVAPQLDDTLAQLPAFRSAADPALQQAIATAPALTRLAQGAAPVVRRTVPTLTSLAALSAATVPVGQTLDHSADNIIAIVDNWSKAVELRDGLSHIFRGEASVSPDLLISAIDRLQANDTSVATISKKLVAVVRAPATSHPTPTPATPAKPTSVTHPSATGLAGVLGGLLGGVEGILKPRTQTGPTSPPPAHDGLQALLGYLLGR